MTSKDDIESIEALAGRSISQVWHIATSDWAEVLGIEFEGGGKAALKRPLPGAKSTTSLEARMLEYLAEHSPLPVPNVLAVSEGGLLMDYIEGGTGGLNKDAQIDAAHHIAGLHAISSDRFGFDWPTLFGPIDQPNDWHSSWPEFYSRNRLIYGAHLAFDAGHVDRDLCRRVEQLCSRLGELLPAQVAPALLHGDLWQGNFIVSGGKIAGFVDPAIYFGAAEADLAFSTLFGTLGAPFFDAYRDIRPIEPGFFETRRDIYNLWPLLGHIRLFGGAYVGQTTALLARLGF